MFSIQSKISQTSISHKFLSPSDLKDSLVHENFIEQIGAYSDFPETLYGDELRLKQVLINLVNNALKFTRGGSVKICAAYDQDNETLSVHVIDDGKGIAPEDIPKLFAQFGKLKRTAEMNSEGIGLGLLICSQIVKFFNGTISTHSKGLGKGATFCFTMQIKKEKARPASSVGNS